MNWEKFKKQLAREAHEYLADLRDIKDGLKSVEGWIALGLVLAAVIMTGAWAVVSMGFNPPNEHIVQAIYWVGMRPCRPVDNFSGVIVFVNLFLLLFLTVITLGNAINMMGRARRNEPRKPRDLVISTSLMLTVGISGILYMLWIC